MYLQKTMAKSPRWEALMELVQLGTGLLLLVFLQFHLLAVSSIILGPTAFNRDAHVLDEYYLSYIGIPLVILAMGSMIPAVHGLLPPGAGPWIELLLASPVVLWGAAPFFIRGWQSVQTRNLNMFTLIALGVSVAYGYSVIASALPGIFPASLRAAG